MASATLAAQNPRQILEPPCAIDEAQKVPSIFDAVKVDVDQEKRPGKYILTGSVRFSKRTLIKESLTGKAKTLQMHPLTCGEALALRFEDRWSARKRDLRVTRKDFQRYLARRGMSAIFERHLQGLEDMMVLHRLSHWQASRTKDIYMPFDAAFFLTLLRLDSPFVEGRRFGPGAFLCRKGIQLRWNSREAVGDRSVRLRHRLNSMRLLDAVRSARRIPDI